MTAHDDLYKNKPLDDEALDELLAATDAELLHQVQRHADPTHVLDALMAADEDAHGRGHAIRPACDHLGRRPSKVTKSIEGSAAKTNRVATVRGRRRMVAFGAAAAMALIAVTPLATRWLSPGWPGERSVKVSSAPVSRTGTETLQATNRKTAVTAKITVQPKPWGTQIGLELYGIRGPLHCQLIVITHAKKTDVATSLRLPARLGYGVPGSPEPLRAKASTADSRSDIDHFEIRTTTGSILISVPA